MEQLIEAFGFDIKLFIANTVNFAALVAILYFIGYKPLLKFIKERTAKIEQGIKDAEDAKQLMQQMQQEKTALITTAQKEAQDIIKKAEERAKANAQALLNKNAEELKKIAQKAKQHIHDEREQMLKETKSEAVSLIVAVAEKVLREKVDAATDKKMIEKLLSEVK